MQYENISEGMIAEEIQGLTKVGGYLDASHKKVTLHRHDSSPEHHVLVNHKGEVVKGIVGKTKDIHRELTGAGFRGDIKEEVLNELSKDLLRSYIQKGNHNRLANSVRMKGLVKDTNNRVKSAADYSADGDTSNANLAHSQIQSNRVKLRDSLRSIQNRSKGLETAAKKLGEEVQIDEISARTLTSYIPAATANAAKHGKLETLERMGGDSAKVEVHKNAISKRVKGVSMAAKKLKDIVKESVELVEISQQGHKNYLKAAAKDVQSRLKTAETDKDYDKIYDRERHMDKSAAKHDGHLANYKHKAVQGLYSFTHHEHPDGSFVQRRVDGKGPYIHQDSKGNRTEHSTRDALIAHVNKLHEEVKAPRLDLEEEMKRRRGRPKKKRDMQGKPLDDDDGQ